MLKKINCFGLNLTTLVYRGPVSECDGNGCSDALRTLLKNATLWNFNVRYVGPDEEKYANEGLLNPNVVLYAQPGAGGDEKDAFNNLKKYAQDVRNFVWNGGRYLGTCMGAYFAGNSEDFPGYDLGLKVGQYIETPGATVKNQNDTIVQVAWRGKTRWMYFQDGTCFKPDSCVNGKTILAYYTNGKVAVMIQPYGSGWIGVSGPHPEADLSWYDEANLPSPGPTVDLGLDLINTLMMQI